VHVDVRGHRVACGACGQDCPPGALAIKGHWVSAFESVSRASDLRPSFTQCGGVTLTGGKPTAQSGFAEVCLFRPLSCADRPAVGPRTPA